MWIVLLWLEHRKKGEFLTAVRNRDGSIKTFPSENEAEQFMIRYNRPNLGSSLILPIE